MKNYKISEFSKRMGVSVDLVKHYQSSGIIEPIVDPQNGYRYFTIRHGERIIASRKYREMGFSVNETKEILYKKNADEIQAMIGEKKKILDKQIELLQLKSNRMQEVQEEIKDMRNHIGEYHLLEMPSYYYITHVYGMDFSEDKSVLKELPTWIEHLDFSYKTYFITRNEDDSWDSTIGIMLEEHYFKELGYESEADLTYLSPSKRLIYYMRAEYTVDQKVQQIAWEHLKEAVRQGVNVEEDKMILQHVYDEYENGIRYINYKLHFFLK